MQIKACYLDVPDRDFLEKIIKAKSILTKCSLCPHNCGVNRYNTDVGICQAGPAIEVAHWQVHKGEETPLADQGGAGAIFFSHCNLQCVFCQNYQISQQKGIKSPLTSEELSQIMLDLQDHKAQNIDLVSPGHYVPLIIEALYFASKKGLNLPIVYNTNGYESPQTLDILSGLIDIYLPDLKYNYEETALKYSKVLDYVYWAQKAIKLMYQQVGDLLLDEQGRAQRGLFVRHLVYRMQKKKVNK
ncbi:MAG: radical SAM protein [Candidatus Omnitrophota bacterium]